jgi:hypothetical protein
MWWWQKIPSLTCKWFSAEDVHHDCTGLDICIVVYLENWLYSANIFPLPCILWDAMWLWMRYTDWSYTLLQTNISEALNYRRKHHCATSEYMFNDHIRNGVNTRQDRVAWWICRRILFHANLPRPDYLQYHPILISESIIPGMVLPAVGCDWP